MVNDRRPSQRSYVGAKLGVRLVGVLVFVFLMSALFNLLILATPFYTIQIYTRVLTSQSIETLVVLTVAALICIAFAALFDTLRMTIMQRMSQRIFIDLGRQVVAASLRPGVNLPSRDLPLQDVEAIRRFLSSREVLNFMDVPFSVLFLALLMFIHPAIGGLSLLVALLVFSLAAVQDAIATGSQRAAAEASRQGSEELKTFGKDMPALAAMGASGPVVERWLERQIEIARQQRRAEGWTTIITGISRFLRFALQLSVMGLAAYFVLTEGLNPGTLIASAILATRALTPIEGLVLGQKLYRAARDAHRRVSGLLSSLTETIGLVHQSDRGEIEVRDLVYSVPGRGQPLLRGLNMTVQPGEIVGIVGPSGSGKSALGQLIVGALVPASGSVLLAGADLRKCDREVLGPMLGYMGQASESMPGTVAETVSRFRAGSVEAIWHAIRAAGAELAVNKLPLGINTLMQDAMIELSPGVYRRLLIARAIYGSPKIVVLDEPSKDLDIDGEEALISALGELRGQGAAVVLVAPRGNLLRALDRVLLVKNGALENVPRSDDGNRAPKRPIGGLRLLAE
jgi:PrtD family type I secretion system ABC transporter